MQGAGDSHKEITKLMTCGTVSIRGHFSKTGTAKDCNVPCHYSNGDRAHHQNHLLNHIFSCKMTEHPICLQVS